MVNAEQKGEPDHILSEIDEAGQLLELAARTVARALACPGRLRAIGDAIAARRLLDQARQRIEHAAAWTKMS